MLYISESEQRALKGLEIRGTFIQKVKGYIRFFISLSNGSVLVASVPETQDSVVDFREIVKKLQYSARLDNGPFVGGRACETIVMNPDAVAYQLRKIGNEIYTFGTIGLCPMDIAGNRNFCFEAFGEDFKKWYRSLPLAAIFEQEKEI